ncbi:hypothetical protein [Actinomyces sp.]
MEATIKDVLEQYEFARKVLAAPTCNLDEMHSFLSHINNAEILNTRRYQLKIASFYNEWVTPAWQSLSPSDRAVLTILYVKQHESRSAAMEDVCDYLCVERSSAYRYREQACHRFLSYLKVNYHEQAG